MIDIRDKCTISRKRKSFIGQKIISHCSELKNCQSINLKIMRNNCVSNTYIILTVSGMPLLNDKFVEWINETKVDI